MPTKIPARISAVLSGIIGLFCYTVAYKGRGTLAEIRDPGQLQDARGFLWFMVFLGTLFLVIGITTWKLVGRAED